jgi:hypothetical protein
LCLVLVAITVVIGPMVARNDLRRDLGNLAMLKAWPLSGATLLRGEILAPAVMLTSIAWLFILGAASLAGNLSVEFLQPLVADRLSYMMAALLLAPGFILVELTMLNGLAVLFPAWISTGATRSRGVDALGQRLFTTAGVLLTLVIALVASRGCGRRRRGRYLSAERRRAGRHSGRHHHGHARHGMPHVVEMLGRVLDRTDVSSRLAG